MPDLQVMTDSSGNFGFGVYKNREWFCKVCLPSLQPSGMAYKQLHPIILACHIWGETWLSKHVQFHCNNQCPLHNILGSSKDDNIMHLVYEPFLITMKYNACISDLHIAGEINAILCLILI